MTIAQEKEDIEERRQPALIENNELWEELTLAQKFAASSLTQFGYELNCIRDSDDTHIAILSCNEDIAVISKAGEIDTESNVRIRL